MQQENNQKKKQRNKWLALINIPIQMGVVIFVFSYVGTWLDDKYTSKNSIFTITLSLLSVFISLYIVIKQVNNINKEK
jgi:F0F1-type ATP synthase assembly protein I